MKFTFPEALWAGTEHSLMVAEEAHSLMMAGMYDVQPSASTTPPEEPWNLSMQGQVAVISIKGPLVNNDSLYNQYRGVVSYDDIRRAMVFAVEHSGAEAILLDIDSGGGAVSGCADTGDLIAMIDKSVMPVFAYSGGNMASAAYWIGVAARAVYVGQTAVTGSIGVMATHKEYSKAFKEAGIGVTVMRAGEFKALANPMEPLSEAAKTQLQEQLNAAYAVFANHVSKQLGVTMETFESTMGQGREFFGKAAVDVGLAKGVKTYDSMVSLVNAKIIDIIGKRVNTASNHQRGLNMSRAALTEQQIAALAAGAPQAKTADEIAAEAAAATAATQAAAAAASATTPPAKVTELENGNQIVAFLQGQIKEKDGTLLAQSVELSGLKAKVASMEATHASLLKIAVASTTHMKVALGLSKVDLSAMGAEQLLAEHSATTTSFTEKFKAGGVAAVSATEAVSTPAGLDHAIAARIEANRYPSKK